MMERPACDVFFGVGTGRCGTMTVANLLSAERGVLALHEGKVRRRESEGEQVLPYLTLQNFLAYRQPGDATAILREKRGRMPEIGNARGLELFGDMAYNYAPFVAAMPAVFPSAKLLFLFRDGRDFVRSAYTSESPDPTPVGWLDPDRPQTRIERFVGLGRLRPAPGDPLEPAWASMSAVEKNAWLWAETNRLILTGLERWSDDRVLRIRFEDFAAAPTETYATIRTFLGIKGDMPRTLDDLLARPINARRHPVLPDWRTWPPDVTAAFCRHAATVMALLGYP